MRDLHLGLTALVRLSDEPTGESVASRLTRTILCVLAVLTLALLVGTGLWYYFRWDDRRRAKANECGPRKFSYHELSAATEGFSPKQAVGETGLGSVFKGFLPGVPVEVAVKRVACDFKHGEQQFLAQVHVVGKIRHSNLVRLHGWCHDKGELLLVYDYLPGGSLDSLLYSKDRMVSWENRMNAVSRVAAAVAYLHDECEQRIVHRGIKASNVMVDALLNPKLGDFGLAPLHHHPTPQATAHWAPELLRSGKATVQTDAYSCGVLLLEVACGRAPVDSNAPSGQVVLLDWVRDLSARVHILEAADPRLLGQFDSSEMSKVLNLALLCCHPDPACRPTLRNVTAILSGKMPLPSLRPTNTETALRDRGAPNRHGASYEQTIDNSDLRETPFSTSSTKYTRMQPLEVDV